jgi:hypothetical protein
MPLLSWESCPYAASSSAPVEPCHSQWPRCSPPRRALHPWTSFPRVISRALRLAPRISLVPAGSRSLRCSGYPEGVQVGDASLSPPACWVILCRNSPPMTAWTIPCGACRCPEEGIFAGRGGGQRFRPSREGPRQKKKAQTHHGYIARSCASGGFRLFGLGFRGRRLHCGFLQLLNEDTKT